MAGNMVYSIQLQLRVDDSQLDATIAKLGTLKKAAKDIHVRTAGGGYRRPKLPEEDIIARSARKWKQRNLEERLNVGSLASAPIRTVALLAGGLAERFERVPKAGQDLSR